MIYTHSSGHANGYNYFLQACVFVHVCVYVRARVWVFSVVQVLVDSVASNSYSAKLHYNLALLELLQVCMLRKTSFICNRLKL